MKLKYYKLVTLPKGTTKIPKVEFGVPSISTTQNGGQVNLSPTTSPSGNTQSGYTVILANKNAGSIVGSGIENGTTPTFLGDELTATAAVETGLEFTFIPNPNITATVKTTITVYGNETGGSQSIPVTITYVQPS